MILAVSRQRGAHQRLGNYTIVPALRAFRLGHSARLVCGGMVSVGLVLSIAGICLVASPVRSSQKQARKAVLTNDLELHNGSGFSSLPSDPKYTACMFWNGLSWTGAVDRTDLPCWVAHLLLAGAGS
jgi:hypothetical protein